MSRIPASYRDPNGYVFEHGGKIFRSINPGYFEHFDAATQSGLYDELFEKKWLVEHKEINSREEFNFPDQSSGKIILPAQIPFISYPYEWSFDMWKDAASLTLNIAGASLKKGLFLKDATPFNIQFFNGSPIFIDTLSFEKYEEGKPWVAYRQFCECFLAPLLLMHYCHHNTHKLFSVYPNGIPLDMLVTLLPGKARWNLNTYLHIFLQKGITSGKTGGKQGDNFSKKKMEILLNGLLDFVTKLKVKKSGSAWDDYYTGTILGESYLKEKTILVQAFMKEIQYESIIDLGANEGHFSLLFEKSAKQIISIDADANCINELYLLIRKKKITNILPLVNDLTAPSPSIGWDNNERSSLTMRLKGDVVFALALVHHLAIGYNLPLAFIASSLTKFGQYLLIEFVPKSDEKVRLLLSHRQDIFCEYTIEHFKEIFSMHYEIIREEKVDDTQRTLFLMKKK